MKKQILILLTVLMTVFLVIGLTACNKNPSTSNDGGNSSYDGGNSNTQTPVEPPKVEYTVTYDANGGKFADNQTTISQSVKEGSTLTAPNSPMRTASSFNGWATDKNGSTLWKFATDTVTSNITLYAIWGEQSATIISVDGASIDEKEMSVFMLVDNSTVSVSLSNKIVCSSDTVWKLYFDKLGQTEIPTKIAAGKSGKLNNGDNIFYLVVSSANGSQVNTYELTVHRRYQVPIKYYDSKGNLIETENTYTGYQYSVNYMPKIEGYTFNYWKDSSGKKTTEFTPYEPVYLYADCTVNTYTVALDVNGGNALDKTEYTVTYDKSFSFSTPTRTGYTFIGWFCGTTQVTNAKGESIADWTYTSDKTLSAGWQANRYSVTATVNNLSAGKVEVYANNSGLSSVDGKYDYDSKVTIKATTYSGYTFLGIYDKNGNKVNDNENLFYTTTLGDEEESYTAKWIKVTIESNLNTAGSVTSLNETYKAEEEVTVIATTNLGYTFVGWYNGKTELTKELSYTFKMPTENVTYTAKWIKVTIESDLNMAGSVTSLNETYKVGEGATVTATKNLGYTFMGWYNGETELTKALSYTFTMPAENITYTAKWKIAEEMNNFIFSSTATTCQITGVKDKTVKKIIVPEYTTFITKGAFSGCGSLTSITLPFVGDSVNKSTDFYQYPFGYIFGDDFYTGGVVVYQNYYGSSTSSATNDYYYIPKSLTSVTITGGNILYGAFSYCTSLTSITLSNSITSIGEYAFSSCTGLRSITLPDSVKSIGEYAFSGCSGLTSVMIPDSVTSIGREAFNYCTGLTSITIPNSVTSIGNEAFCGCTGLKNVIIPNSVTSIGYSVFYGCTDLTSITIPDSVTSIDGLAFYNCDSLTSVTIGNGVTKIDKDAFRGCNGLTSVYYHGTADEWNKIGFGPHNESLTNAAIYYYSGTKPTESGNYWHYEGGVATPW